MSSHRLKIAACAALLSLCLGACNKRTKHLEDEPEVVSPTGTPGAPTPTLSPSPSPAPSPTVEPVEDETPVPTVQPTATPIPLFLDIEASSMATEVTRIYAVSDEFYINVDSNSESLECKSPSAQTFEPCQISERGRWQIGAFTAGGSFSVRATRGADSVVRSVSVPSFASVTILTCDVNIPNSETDLSALETLAASGKTICVEGGTNLTASDGINITNPGVTLFVRKEDVVNVSAVSYSWARIALKGVGNKIIGFTIKSSSNNGGTYGILSDRNAGATVPEVHEILYNTISLSTTNGGANLYGIQISAEGSFVKGNVISIAGGTEPAGITLNLVSSTLVENQIISDVRGAIGIHNKQGNPTVQRNKIVFTAASGGGNRRGIYIESGSGTYSENNISVDGGDGCGISKLSGGLSVFENNVVDTSGNCAAVKVSGGTGRLSGNLLRRKAEATELTPAVYVATGASVIQSSANVVCKLGASDWGSGHNSLYGLLDDDTQHLLTALWAMPNQTQLSGACP